MKILQNEIKKIAVFRALQLGDLLCSIPAIKALRYAFPDATITLWGMPWAASLVERFPHYIHSFKHFPGYPGLPEQKVEPKAFTKFLAEVQEEEYDLVLQMQGNGSIVNPMIELFGGKLTVGFCLEDDYTPNNKLFLPYPTGIHEIERHLALINYLGIESRGKELEFPLYEKDYKEYNAAGFSLQPKKYVCVHPGSRGEWRQWPPKYFAALGNYCEEQGLTIVLTGTKEELSIVNEVKQYLKKEPVVAAGKTTMGAAAILIKNAFMLISNCTGVSHIASAMKTPGIIISMDGEPERWAPLNKELHRTIDWTKTADFEIVFAELKNLFGSLQRNQSRNETIAVSSKHITD